MVTSRARPADTSEPAWQRMLALWREKSPAERAEAANRLSIDALRLAEAGVRTLEPQASEARVRYVLAVRRYGRDLADEVYGAESSSTS